MDLPRVFLNVYNHETVVMFMKGKMAELILAQWLCIFQQSSLKYIKKYQKNKKCRKDLIYAGTKAHVEC